MINIRYLDIRTRTIVGLAGQLGWPGNVCGTENLCQPLSLSLTTGQLLAVTRRDSSPVQSSPVQWSWSWSWSWGKSLSLIPS